MDTKFMGYTSTEPRGRLVEREFTWGELPSEEVELEVLSCGICHSDLSMIDNEWGLSSYPFIPGHEVIGKITAMGEDVKGLELGQVVGVGWYSKSCQCCRSCLRGDHNLCSKAEPTMKGNNGGFADKVRCHWLWAIPLPDGMDPKTSGPLFCGGITVFNPIIQCNVRPTHRVGVIGLGGLGHFATQFLNKWGCEVTVFTSHDSKADEAMALGAHQVVNSVDEGELVKVAGSLDFILSTVNVELNWTLYLNALSPRGILHEVGAVISPMQIMEPQLLSGQKSLSGSPVGSPVIMKEMLDFCSRHEIKPQAEIFPMTEVNEGLDHLRSGKARYRVVLTR